MSQITPREFAVMLESTPAAALPLLLDVRNAMKQRQRYREGGRGIVYWGRQLGSQGTGRGRKGVKRSEAIAEKIETENEE